MRVTRFLALTVLLVAGLAGPSFAQRITEPGTYDVRVGVAPALLPPGSLPADLPELGPDVYTGTLEIARNEDGTYSAHLKAESEDGNKVIANAAFESDWAGFLTGTIVVGSQPVENALIGIDVANLLRANVVGVGHVDGTARRVIVRFGAGGTLEKFLVVPPGQTGIGNGRFQDGTRGGGPGNGRGIGRAVGHDRGEDHPGKSINQRIVPKQTP